MKSNNGIRERGMKVEPDEVKKAVKLTPMKKSGKDKHIIYKSIDDEDDEDYDFGNYKKRESVLDYFDDEDEENNDYGDEDEEYDDYDDEEDE